MNDIALDPIRSARFGEPVPTAIERARLKAEGVEHIDASGRLQVPVEKSIDPTPVREGWVPYFVAVSLDRSPQKWITYRRPRQASLARDTSENDGHAR